MRVKIKKVFLLGYVANITDIIHHSLMVKISDNDMRRMNSVPVGMQLFSSQTVGPSHCLGSGGPRPDTGVEMTWTECSAQASYSTS